MIDYHIGYHFSAGCMQRVDEGLQLTAVAPRTALSAQLNRHVAYTARRFGRRWQPYKVEIASYLFCLLREVGPLSRTATDELVLHLSARLAIRAPVETLQHHITASRRNRTAVGRMVVRISLTQGEGYLIVTSSIRKILVLIAILLRRVTVRLEPELNHIIVLAQTLGEVDVQITFTPLLVARTFQVLVPGVSPVGINIF